MEPKKYRKRPVEVEVLQWTGNNFSDMRRFTGWYAEVFASPEGSCLLVRTMEGNYVAKPGDYIIRGVQGEFYPCKADVFTETYEEVDISICAVTGQPCCMCQCGPCESRRGDDNV